VDAYAGFEPQVGEIRAVRTFRVGPGGTLYPLFSGHVWSDGANTAQCMVIGRTGAAAGAHAAPEPGCTCGFYAFAGEQAAAEYPNARHVLAVVACWGHVIAGTRGIRAEHARIEAIWMSATVPPDLANLVRTRYPATFVYADRSAMLAEHPPTDLDCYEEPAPSERRWRRVGLWAVTAAALVTGVLPARWLGSNQDARIVWAAEMVFFAVGALVLRRRHTDVAARRRGLLFVAVTLWLSAPFAGTIGVLLLRLPLVQIAALFLVQRALLARAASTFPAEVG
jgi:hypothetical protein